MATPNITLRPKLRRGEGRAARPEGRRICPLASAQGRWRSFWAHKKALRKGAPRGKIGALGPHRQ